MAPARLRVAVVVHHFPVVSQTFVVNLIEGLRDRGHTVDICVLNSHTPDLHAETGTEHLSQHVCDLATQGSIMQANAGLRWLQLAIERPGLSVRLLPALVKRNGLGPELIHRSFALRRSYYDIVHCQFGTCGLKWASLLDYGICAGKLVLSFRGNDVSSLPNRKGRDVYRNLFARADLCLPNCDFFAQRLLKMGCDDRRMEVYRSAIAVDKIPFRERQCQPGRPLRLLTVGRLVEKKGIEFCIRAVAGLASEGHRLEYRIIGDGPLRASLERLIEQLDAASVIRLEGRKGQAEVFDTLPTSDLFLACSVTASTGDQDGPVNVLKEAMASGMPVIGTRHGGIPELITDGREGFLVPERDVHAIQNRIRWLQTHPEHWPQMGRAGRARVQRDYDLTDWNDRLVELYRKLLSTQPAHRCAGTAAKRRLAA